MTDILDFFTIDKVIEIAGLLLGLAYLYFEYHANKLVWLMSVIMPMISLYVYYTSGLYADFAINIYYLIIAIYGYVVWTLGPKNKNKDPKPITHMPIKCYPLAVCATGIIFAFLAWGLIHFTNSNVPYWDAFTTALSIVAMWMLAQKYAEQWLAWFIVDAVCTGLYFYKGREFYSLLYAVYTVVAIFGYLKWLRLMKQEH